MRSERAVRAAWWTAGGVTVLGVMLSLVGAASASSSASFGWFAYQPLAAATFSPFGPFALLHPASFTGAVLLALGLLGLAFLAGRHVGVRAARPRADDER